MRSPQRPHIVILAGPNGAGKSTAAPALLRDALAVTEFVNADVIARGLSGFNPDDAALAAGRIMLDQLDALADGRANFAFETTLASRTFVPRIIQWQQQGYGVHVIFLSVPSPEFSIQRVRERVSRGGHDVPPDTIRRRYFRGVANFFELYQPRATTWRLYDNSRRKTPRLIARGAGATVTRMADQISWNRLKEVARNA